MGFPGGSAGKESACNGGDLGSIPGLGISPGEGKGYPLQSSGLETSMDLYRPLGHRVRHRVTFTFTSFQPYSVVRGKATALPVRPMRAAGGQPESPCWLNWNFERCVCVVFWCFSLFSPTSNSFCIYHIASICNTLCNKHGCSFFHDWQTFKALMI